MTTTNETTGRGGRAPLVLMMVFSAVLGIALWEGVQQLVSPAQAAPPKKPTLAETSVLDSGAQRVEALQQAKETNKKLDLLIGLFKDGNAKVKVVEDLSGAVKTPAKPTRAIR